MTSSHPALGTGDDQGDPGQAAAGDAGATHTLAGATSLPPVWLLAALVCLAAAGVAGLLLGPADLPARSVLAELVNRIPGIHATSGLSVRQAAILWQLRVPRVLAGGLVGAMLAMAGAAYQGVFRNPLADPYLLGVAAGAGLGVTLAIAYGQAAAMGPLSLVPLAGFLGALLGVGATYALGRSGPGGRTTGTLILAGVAVAAFMTATQTFVQQRHSQTLRQVYVWILGTLARASWQDVWLMAPYVAVSATVLLLHHRLLDVMSFGDEEANSLGVEAARTRVVVVVAATVGTAAAVAVSGLIGFVGIIVPHTVRLVVGPSHRLVLPLSFVFGGAFLILADVLARLALQPAEIPIGVVTAFFGAPFFLLVLRRSTGVRG
jgi:iron complex transport system permease protein